MTRLKVTIVGAGEIGRALARTLLDSDQFEVQIIDRSEEALARLKSLQINASAKQLRHGDDLQGYLSGQDVVVAAVPEAVVPDVARAAAKAAVHYLDFICLNQETKTLLDPLAQKRAIFSGCGVSPGLIGNVTCDLLQSFSPVTDVTMRVGAIPRYPTNRIGYGQIWNVDGLIDEYTRPSAAIRDGKPVYLTPLEEYSRLSIDGISYEEFITSGGVEALSIFSHAAPKNVTFKTIRYPGHLDYIRFLLDDLNLRNRRDMLRSLLYNGLPVIEDDILLLMVTARGYRDRLPTERTKCYRFAASHKTSPFNSLIACATGYAAALLSMLCQGRVASQGYISHHLIDTQELLASPFLEHLRER